eukprot:gene18089-22146_t
MGSIGRGQLDWPEVLRGAGSPVEVTASAIANRPPRTLLGGSSRLPDEGRAGEARLLCRPVPQSGLRRGRQWFRKIQLHDVRHSAATLLLQAGIPPGVVAGILGHSPAAPLTTFAHSLPDAKRDAVDVLTAIFRAAN